MEHRRHFSVEQANALRPWIADRVERLRKLRTDLRGSELGPFAPLATASGGAWPGREHAQAIVHLQLTLEELRRSDIVIRDLDRGLIDFPAVRDGDEVYLCWLVGEPEIRHWHELESGFAARRPL